MLELGVAEAGQYCGRLLADLGARVIAIEPLTGTASRSIPPYVHDESGRRRSVPHEYLNTGKESLALDLEDGALADVLRSFEGKADVLLHGSRWTTRLPTDLRIPTVGTGIYGASGPRADAPSTSFTRFQTGGSGSIMPAPRPAAPGTLAGECFSGAGLAMTVLALIVSARRSGVETISRADHSEQAHFLNLEKMFIGRISKEKAVVTRESHRYPFGGAVRCKDGFVSMLINEKHQWRGFCEAIGRPEWASDERFAMGSARYRMKADIEAALGPWCAARTRAEVVNAMRSRDVPIGAVKEVRELVGDAALRSRGFVRDQLTPYGRAAVLGLPFGGGALWRPSGRAYAPLVGEHTVEILRELGWSSDAVHQLQEMNVARSEHAPA